MKVRFLKDWRYFAAGTITEWNNASIRDDLLRKKIIDIVEPGDIETAVVQPEETAALRIDPPKRKRGRPRKVIA